MWREDIVCRSVTLKGLPDLVDSLGGDSQAWLCEVGLNPSDLEHDATYISWVRAYHFIAHAAQRLSLSDLGLRWAMAHKPDFSSLGPLAIMALIAPDVRAFAKMWIEYDKIHTNGSYTALAENETDGVFRAIVHYNSAASDSRQVKEYFLLTLCLMAKMYGPFQYQVLRIGFPHKPMSALSVYESYFDCEIEFSAEQTYIEFPYDLLEHKLGWGFNAARKAFETYTQSRIKKSPTCNVSMSAHVAQILPSILGVNASHLESMAHILGMNAKKLQRLLSDEGTSYSAILDEVRESLACQLLRDSDIAIYRISALLDYASPISFRNACKRWTGMSPRAYRQYARQQNR